jgi:hypothetical protein
MFGRQYLTLLLAVDARAHVATTVDVRYNMTPLRIRIAHAREHAQQTRTKTVVEKCHNKGCYDKSQNKSDIRL